MSEEVLRVPMLFAFGTWLESKKQALNLPTIQTDILEEYGKSLCISQSAGVVTEKEYVNGARQCRLNIDIIAQGSEEDRRDLIDCLTTLCFLFENLCNETVDVYHTILRATSTAPTLKEQSENGVIRYVISVSIIYKEI